MTDEQTKRIICEKCVHKEVCRIKSFHKLFNLVVIHCNKFLEECVDDAPTIKSEPIKHGEWFLESESEYSETEDIFYCSQCKNAFIFQKGCRFDFNHCPKCGAKMDEEEIMWKRCQRYLKEFLMKTE